MPQGPGKYDDLATYCREQSAAEAVVVLVFGGNQGSGFSVQTKAGVLINMSAALRVMADEIDRSMSQA